MDKNAIKKFAVWARKELIARVSLKALEYGITEDGYGETAAEIISGTMNGKVLTYEEKKQRQALIAEIKDKGYKQVMEEVAYTWFNRFSALRFMEVNGYLPSHVRVFTDEENNFKPQIITEAIHLDLDGLNMEKVFALKEAEKTEELYKYLLIVQCNALNKILPGIFQKIADYTELLLPDNLLREGSVIQQMIELIPEDDWKDAVQIIGWLYQYYNSEKKDDVFAALKKNVKITKENIPAATQLFTPDWIVRYMVENSLGRLWVEGHPNDELKSQWKYYLEEAEQGRSVQAQLAEIRKECATLLPEQIKAIDPCSGSGHILVYMFDVLIQIYEAYGYTTREAVASIIENNLYGLDIDDRAAQLAYFAVMMKARQYDRRFFSRGIQPHIYAIQESNDLDSYALEYFYNGDVKLKNAMKTLISEMYDAKEYGSILDVSQVDFIALNARFEEIKGEISIYRDIALNQLMPFIQCAEAMAQKYHIVVTNPPYMGSNNMSTKLTKYVKANYSDSKTDLYSVFIEKCNRMVRLNGYQAMITQQGWMFFASMEIFRSKILLNDIINMAHLGSRAFNEISGEVVQTTSFVLAKHHILDYKGCYARLLNGASEEAKERMFFEEDHYVACQRDFSFIPGQPIAYWVGENFMKAFKTMTRLGEHVECAAGISTGDNDKYLKLWYEVDFGKIAKSIGSDEEFSKSGYKYAFCNKGGGFRKWYGNNEYVADWANSDKFHRNGATYKHLLFIPGITWSEICMGSFGARFYPVGQIFDHKSPGMFLESSQNLYGCLGFLNSVVSTYILGVINPTISTGADSLRKIPVDVMSIQNINVSRSAEELVSISKEDWDSFETSWDFNEHPLIRISRGLWDATAVGASMHYYYGCHLKVSCPLELCYMLWQGECNERFQNLKAKEDELNRVFIDIYGLQEELKPEVEDKDVTVRKADLGRDIRSFISYAVGCMFGRYSLDVDGLVYAGGEWDGSKYASFLADKDNILPICDDEYFEDDIVGRFVEFVKTVYGMDTLDENLKFIADALGGKGQPKDVIRNYFLNNFYSDHCKIYQKRPIYWLFDSGKKNGFKALIYMHRYQPDTIARIRTDYVHEQQARYRTAIVDLEQRIANASTGERVKLKKKLTALQAQDTEIRTYEEKIHHLADQMISIDLDDGVKKNYAIFQDVLAKIK